MPKYLQVHFNDAEKKQLAIAAIEFDSSMASIVRQAVSEFLVRQSAETNAGDSYASLSAEFAAHKEKMRRQLDEVAQYKIIVAYRDESESEPQWITFIGTDKEDVRGKFEEFAILNHIYSVREVGA